MTDELKTQLYKMTFVLALLGALGLWQLEFVIDAINANVFLNMTIFGTFAFGVFVAYRNVLGLRNEQVAYNSLREDYEDARNAQAQDKADPFWRYYRCEADAVIFAPPRILEQPYHIISEEIARTRNLSMSTGVMQNLLDSVDERLDEQRSLISYVTGLLVFLGLIGTFVGLMVTLGSVGAIIGGLDLTGGAGAAAIQGLMEDLKIPLQGMATGFSSSLFGLITSLALGLIGRFASQAAGSLKSNFATWLAGVAKVDGEVGANGPIGSQSFSAEGERMLSMMYRVAKILLVSNTRMVSSVDMIADGAKQIAEVQLQTHKATASVGEALGQLLESQAITTDAINQMANVLETRVEMRNLIDTLRADADAQKEVQEVMTERFAELYDRQEALQEMARRYHREFASRDDVRRMMEVAQERIIDDFSKLHGSVETLSDALQTIDTALGTNAAMIQTTRHELEEMSGLLANDLRTAIASSREAIARADAIEEEYGDLSVHALQTRLIDQFGKLAEEQSAEAGQEKANERDGRFFRLFNRRAG